MAIAGMVGAVYISDINNKPPMFYEEELQSDDTRTRFTVVDPAHKYWSLQDDVDVSIDGIDITTGFTLEYIGGSVIFDEPVPEGKKVSVIAQPLVIVQAGGFFNWSIDGDGEDAEATTFQSQGWKEFMRTLKGWSGSADAYWGDTQFYDSLGEIIVVKLFVDSGPSQDCLEGFAVINGDGIEAPVDGLIQETVDFTGTGPLHIRM